MSDELKAVKDKLAELEKQVAKLKEMANNALGLAEKANDMELDTRTNSISPLIKAVAILLGGMGPNLSKEQKAEVKKLLGI